MSIKREYEKIHQVLIVKIESEFAKLVTDHGCKVGDEVVIKLGDFHKDINDMKFIKVVIFGICDDFKLGDRRFVVLKDLQVKSMVKNMTMKKDKFKGMQLENEELKAELEKLKTKGISKNIT